jgi:phage shock protein C
MENKRLYRSRTDRLLFGVCGGLGEYTGIDPTIIRLVWALVSVLMGLGLGGLIIYLIAWVIIPEPPEA